MKKVVAILIMILLAASVASADQYVAGRVEGGQSTIETAREIVHEANQSDARVLTQDALTWLKWAYGHDEKTYLMATECWRHSRIDINYNEVWSGRMIASKYQDLTEEGKRLIYVAKGILDRMPGPCQPQPQCQPQFQQPASAPNVTVNNYISTGTQACAEPVKTSWKLHPSAEMVYEPGWLSAAVGVVLTPGAKGTTINNGSSSTSSACAEGGAGGSSLNNLTSTQVSTQGVGVNTGPGSVAVDTSGIGTGNSGNGAQNVLH